MALCDRLEAAQAERETRRNRVVVAALWGLNEREEVGQSPEGMGFHLEHLSRLTALSDQVERLRQTILTLAVRGRLTKHNSDDGLASQLLDHLRAEKAALVKQGLAPRVKVGTLCTDDPPLLPDNWIQTSVGEVCSLITSGSRGWAEHYSATGAKFIRAQNIRFGRLRLDDLACVNPPQVAEKTRTRARKGDVLLVITGAGVTNPGLLDRELGEAYVSQHVALVRPTVTDLSRWLLLWLMAPGGARTELVERAYGAGKPGLNLDNIRSLPLALPPTTEQRRIVAKVDELMALCDALKARIADAQTTQIHLADAIVEQAVA